MISILTKRVSTALLAVALMVPLAMSRPAGAGDTPAPGPGGTFVDDDGNTHEGMIEQMAALAITLGCEPALYCPADSVNRGQMASFLARAFGLPAPSDDYFDDDAGSTHEDNINRVYEAGITTGYSDGTYRPGDIVNRAQMASFLARAVGLAPIASGPFVDVSGTHAGNINAIAADGITAGCALGATYYCPDDPVRRDQMASFLGRALDLTPLSLAARDWDIAVAGLDTDDVPNGIRVVNANTAASTQVTTDVDTNPLWNHDKSRIAYSRLFAELFDDPILGEDWVPPAGVADADGSTEYDVDAWLEAAGETLGSFNYSFGPDGRLALDGGDTFVGTERDLWIADIDMAMVTELAADAGWWLTDPKWSFAGDYIAVYAGDGTGNEAIRIFDAASGVAVVDIPEPANFFDFAWSPTGEVLLVHLASSAIQNELLYYDPAILDGIPFFVPAGNLGDFEISPDGSQVAFVSDADGDSEVYILDFGTEDVTQVTFTDSIDEREPVWSPDGVMLAVEENAVGRVKVVVAATGTEVASISSAQDPDW